jgi:hypothetical protein
MQRRYPGYIRSFTQPSPIGRGAREAPLAEIGGVLRKVLGSRPQALFSRSLPSFMASREPVLDGSLPGLPQNSRCSG